MVEYAGYEEERPERVIETASATTSPDNAKSGSFAFIIAAVAIAVSLLFGGAIAGCLSLASELIIETYSSVPTPNNIEGYEQYYDNYLDDTYDFDGRDDPFRDWGGDMDGFDGFKLDNEKTTQS